MLVISQQIRQMKKYRRVMTKNVPVCQGSALKSLDTISHASNNGMTKSGRRVQKHDDRWKE